MTPRKYTKKSSLKLRRRLKHLIFPLALLTLDSFHPFVYGCSFDTR